MGDTWDAEPEQLKEPEMTTDDLVMMVGEATIKLRHSKKMVIFLKQKVAALINTEAKEKSLALTLKSQIDTLLKEKEAAANSIQSIGSQTESLKARIVQLENQVAEVAAQRDEAQKGQHPRIVQLEEQVHSVALERDEARKEILELKNKPPVKRKK